MRFLSNLLASTLGALLALGIIFFIFFLIIFAIAAAGDSTPGVERNSVLVVRLAGPVPEITADDPLMRVLGDEPDFDLRDLTQGLRKAAADDRISGVWLQVEDASMSWASLEEVRAALLRFKASGKPIYASSDDYTMNEAGYFVASTADSIFAAPQAMFEFNGFFIATEYYKGLLDKLEVAPQIVRAGRFKSAVEPFQRTDMSPESELMLNSLIQSWNQVFIAAVAESRNIPAQDLQRTLSESAILSSAGAYAAGLFDALLYRDQVLDVMRSRFDMDPDEDLRTVKLNTYADVPTSDAGLETGGDGDVAIVYAAGAIMSGESGSSANPLMGGTVVGAKTFNEAMREARESDQVKAIVLRVNSPGGSAPAADAMWREIALAAAEKPLVVSMGDYAASGGYWISTPAETIVASPLTLTGSIGVYSVFFDASGLFSDKLGITHDFVRTSPYADMYSALRGLSDRERALLEASVDETYGAFLENVAQGRGLDVASVDSIGQGRVWTGAQAQELGLVDELGDLESAVAIAAEKAGLAEGSYRTRILPRPKTFIERMAESLDTRATAWWQGLTQSPIERAVMQQAALFRYLNEIQATPQARLPFDLRVY